MGTHNLIFTQLQTQWPDVIRDTRQRSRVVSLMLESVALVGLEPGEPPVLVMTTTYRPSFRRWQGQVYREIAIWAIEHATGWRVQVRVELVASHEG